MNWLTLDKKNYKIKKISLMCPKCFHKEEYKVHLEILDDKKLNLSVQPWVKCPECKAKGMLQIDTKIIDDIISLNKNGYTTKYCCAGHAKALSGTYISFADAKFYEDMKRFKMSIPEHLEIQLTENRFDKNVRIGVANYDEGIPYKELFKISRKELHDLIHEVITRKTRKKGNTLKKGVENE